MPDRNKDETILIRPAAHKINIKIVENKFRPGVCETSQKVAIWRHQSTRPTWPVPAASVPVLTDIRHCWCTDYCEEQNNCHLHAINSFHEQKKKQSNNNGEKAAEKWGWKIRMGQKIIIIKKKSPLSVDIKSPISLTNETLFAISDSSLLSLSVQSNFPTAFSSAERISCCFFFFGGRKNVNERER